MSKKITTEIFKERLKNILGDEYTCIGEYKGKYTPIQIQHSCGYCYEITPRVLQNTARLNNTGCQCPLCRHNRLMKYNKKDIENMFVQNGKKENEYTVLEYTSNKTNMLIRHNVCGCEFKLSLSNYKKTKRLCPNCDSGFSNDNFINKRKSIDELKECLKNKNPEYELVSQFRLNRNTDLIFRHKPCGTEFTAKPYAANKENQLVCPICVHRSVYENKIKLLLQSYNINFIEQKMFSDCKYKNCLRFDFYLPDYNICIEYDGEYHDHKFKTDQNLEESMKRDQIKNEYCHNNNISLIRISYKEQNQWKRYLINRLCKANKQLKLIFKSSTTIESIANKKNVSE